MKQRNVPFSLDEVRVYQYKTNMVFMPFESSCEIQFNSKIRNKRSTHAGSSGLRTRALHLFDRVLVDNFGIIIIITSSRWGLKDTRCLAAVNGPNSSLGLLQDRFDGTAGDRNKQSA